MVIFFKKLRKLSSDWDSSVTKGGGGARVSPIGLLTKNAEEEKISFCAGMD